MCLWIHFPLIQGKSLLFKYLAQVFSISFNHYPKDTTQAGCEWFQLDESGVNLNAQENNFVIHLI